MSVRQATLPERIETARTTPRALPMNATPLQTTAGNSIRLPIPRDQAIRNGGRMWMFVCAWVRAGVTPYSGHCDAGLKRKSVTHLW